MIVINSVQLLALYYEASTAPLVSRQLFGNIS